MQSSSSILLSRRALLGSGAAAFAFAAAPGWAQAAAARDWSSLDAIVDGAIRDKAVPGMQLCVTAGGRPIYTKAAGAADIEAGSPLAATHVLRIGSLTKQFTAAAVLALQDAGKLSIDAPLSRFVPELPAIGAVQLRHLLTHQSGLFLPPPADPREMVMLAARPHNASSLLAAIAARGPVARTPAGTVFQYDNLNYQLLGIVAERAAGVSLGEVYRTRLTSRAGLTRTALDDDRPLAERARGYDAMPDLEPPFRPSMPHSPTYAAGAGGMRSTAEELCKWHHALLSAQVLPRTTLDLMLTPARFADGSPAVRQGPPGSPPAPANYGMGIAIANENGRRMVTHNGAINGFLGQLDSYPDQQVSIAVLMNAGPAARFAVPAPDGGQRSPGAPAAPSSPTPGQTPAAGTAPTVIRRVASAEELQALRAGAPNQVALRAALREAARIALA